MQIDSTDYSILQIIYQIVREDPQPLKYQLYPRELILRSVLDWSVIQSSLIVLEHNGAIITTRQSDKLQISLTGQGLQMCNRSAFS